jgi:hypothetical protein
MVISSRKPFDISSSVLNSSGGLIFPQSTNNTSVFVVETTSK